LLIERQTLPRMATGAQYEHIRRPFTDEDPMRNVVACAACHGPGGVKTGAPALIGQPTQYLDDQLSAFSQGMRANDIKRILHG
jgi:cytochrome c553